MIGARFRALTANSTQIRTSGLEAQVGALQTKLLEQAKRKLQQYPGAIASSRYNRTGDLGRSWRIAGPNSTASGLTSILVNDASYSGFVQGPNQVGVHRGRWTTLAEAIDPLRSVYRDELRGIVKGLIV